MCTPKDWDIIAFGSKKPDVQLPQNFNFVKGSIADDTLVSRSLKDVDIVLHLAAIKGREHCSRNPVDAIEVNVVGTHKLLKAAILNRIKKFLFASTYEVYGDKSDLPFTEESSVSPSELYGLTKAISEIEISRSGLDYIILRFTNIFGMGSGIRPEEVNFNFIKSAFEGKPLVLHGGGNQTLDFVDIGDVCECLLKIISNQKISKSILNIGSGKPMRVSSAAYIIADIFKKKYNKPVTFTSTPLFNSHLQDRWISTYNLEKEIGKLDLKPFELSIESYIQDYAKKYL